MKVSVRMKSTEQVGIKAPNQVAIPSVRNDAAFLYTLVGVTSVLAVLGGFLPGDWVRPRRDLRGSCTSSQIAINDSQACSSAPPASASSMRQRGISNAEHSTLLIGPRSWVAIGTFEVTPPAKH